MVRHETRNYTIEDTRKVLSYICNNEPVRLNDVILDLGPDIELEIIEAVDILFEKGVIGNKEAFLKTHIDFNPWDTIVYDGIDDDYIGVKSNYDLYLTESAYDNFDLKPKNTVK